MHSKIALTIEDFDSLSAVYDSLTIEDFEIWWVRMVSDYYLMLTEWLGGLWEERVPWVPIYVKRSFWAGTFITRRSKSSECLFTFTPRQH